MKKAGGTSIYSTLGHGDSIQSWRKTIPNSGTVINVQTSEILMKNLPLPHSPRLYNGNLYMLFSATREIVCADPEKRTYEVVNWIEGFVRGMARQGDYIFVPTHACVKTPPPLKICPLRRRL
ncbi:MAG: DUF4915 domain-containing protein [Spirochaetales bacterium]|nr:DUF4915 domain-containing protein [Spirochaetales bacterium]